MNKTQKLHEFWSSFGWAAYDENTVPDNALAANNNRYITYSVSTDSFGNELMMSASLWHRSTSWETISKKAEEISKYIETEMPPSFLIDEGRVKIRKGVPFAQRMGDDDDTIRRILINISAEFLTKY